MSTAPSSPTESTASSRIRRDTGFPETICGHRNTTLPHPDADLSPNATLSFEDIDPAKVIARTRLSFLAKNRRTISHGKIATGLGIEEGQSRSELGSAVVEDGSLAKPSTESTHSHSHSDVPSSPGSDKKRNLFRRLLGKS